MATELPEETKRLYRHWGDHTLPASSSAEPNALFKDKKLFEEIDWFITERMNIWRKKTHGEKVPFTKDEILATYKFCNIFRELDRQTIEFHTLLKPLHGNFPLWLLNMFYCRMVARPDTIKYTGLLSFDPEVNKAVYEKLMDSPRPRFGTPYVFPVSVILKGNTPTRELFACQYLPSIMTKIAASISSWHKKSVYDAVEEILPIFKYDLRFHWTEVCIDVAYQYPEYLDLFARFPIGPGAAPTLERINQEENPSFLVTKLSSLNINTGLTFNKMPVALSAENWEGIACEFRKYTNLSSGTGRKRLYKNKGFASPQTELLF